MSEKIKRLVDDLVSCAINRDISNADYDFIKLTSDVLSRELASLTQQAEANKEARAKADWLDKWWRLIPAMALPSTAFSELHALSQPSPVEARPDLLKELIEYEKRGGKILFWTCPKGCQGYVEWSGNIATCKTCGEKSRPKVEAQENLK